MGHNSFLLKPQRVEAASENSPQIVTEISVIYLKLKTAAMHEI